MNEYRRRVQQSRAEVRTRMAAAQETALAPSQGLVFDGPSESDTDVIPPDSQVAAGPNNVVVAINSLLAIYNKSGNTQGGFQPLSSFFASLGTVGEIYDPMIIYDQADSRFLLSAAQVDMTNFTSGKVLIAVSQTSDPTGVWNKYAIDFEGRNVFDSSENTFPDFPTLGLSSSAIYVSTAQFALNASCAKGDEGTCSFSDTWIKVIGLPELLSGSATLSITTFQNVETAAGKQAFAIEPAVTYGSSPEEFLAAADFNSDPSTTLDVFSINTSGTPMLSTASLTVPAYRQPPSAAQPGNLSIATNDFRLLNAVWSNGSLWTAQNVLDTSSGAAVARWYEIAATNLASVSLTQSGSVAGNGDAYFPAVAVKPDGDVGIVFTTSSSTQYASAAVTGRGSSDPAGTMRTFVIYKPGKGFYQDFGLRWGDYGGASLDPDGSTIWTIAECAGSPNPHFGTAVDQLTQIPSLRLSATALDFGSATVGVSTASQALTVTNAGGTPVTFGTLALSGANPQDFAIGGDSCSGATLAAAANCAIELTFTPTTTGARASSLAVTSSAGTFASVVYLKGFGVPLSGSLVLSPSAVNFPNTVLRTASAPQTIKLTNVSPSSIPLTGIRLLTSNDFSETNDCPPVLAAGASCMIQVEFRPTIAGIQTNAIEVQSGTSLVSITVQGMAVTAPQVTLCPTTLGFAAQAVGTTSAAETVTLSNTGSDTLTVTSGVISGDFAMTNSCGSIGATLPAHCDAYGHGRYVRWGAIAPSRHIGQQVGAQGRSYGEVVKAGIPPQRLRVARAFRS